MASRARQRGANCPLCPVLSDVFVLLNALQPFFCTVLAKLGTSRRERFILNEVGLNLDLANVFTATFLHTRHLLLAKLGQRG